MSSQGTVRATGAVRSAIAASGRVPDRQRVAWLFLAPATLFLTAYILIPIVRVIWLSFTDYQALASKPATFIGLANYIEALRTPLLWYSLARAGEFTLLFLPGTILLPLLLAVLIDSVDNPRLAAFYRMVLVLPALLPSTLVFVLWKWLFNYQVGPINHVLVDVLHLYTLQDAPQWLGGTALTLPAIAIMEIWWGLGYHTLFFLTGLAAIPRNIAEAARLDGANEWRVFWHIKRPYLTPILSVLIILRFGTAMAVIDEYLIFGGFNRASPTYTWTMFMYDQAFKTGLWRQGFAAAIALIGAVATMAVLFLLLRVLTPDANRRYERS